MVEAPQAWRREGGIKVLRCATNTTRCLGRNQTIRVKYDTQREAHLRLWTIVDGRGQGGALSRSMHPASYRRRNTTKRALLTSSLTSAYCHWCTRRQYVIPPPATPGSASLGSVSRRMPRLETKRMPLSPRSNSRGQTSLGWARSGGNSGTLIAHVYHRSAGASCPRSIRDFVRPC